MHREHYDFGRGKTDDAGDGLSRRDFVRATGAAALVVIAGAVVSPREAWGLEVQALKPGTMRTLVKIARDIYPHDGLPDRAYAGALKPYDVEARADAAALAMLESGTADIDRLAQERHGMPYFDLPAEDTRVAILAAVSGGALFRKLQGDLRRTLYNAPEVWTVLGYEGESFSRGGYLERGFDDLEWL